MKGMGCDETTLISILTSPRYRDPWAMHTLVTQYNDRTVRNLDEDIKKETGGLLEDGLRALVRGPLRQDVYQFKKSCDGAGTDEEGVMDVLLNRSNADLRAICAEYKRRHGKELSDRLKKEVNEETMRLFSMLLSGTTKAEESAPVIPADIDAKVTEIQRSTEGMFFANAISVAQIFTSCNQAQLRALQDHYRAKYQRDLLDVVKKEFRGDFQDAVIRMLVHARDRAQCDAMRLQKSLWGNKTSEKRLFVWRVCQLWWDRERLAAAKQAYVRTYRRTLEEDVKVLLNGNAERFVLALLK